MLAPLRCVYRYGVLWVVSCLYLRCVHVFKSSAVGRTLPADRFICCQFFTLFPICLRRATVVVVLPDWDSSAHSAVNPVSATSSAAAWDAAIAAVAGAAEAESAAMRTTMGIAYSDAAEDAATSPVVSDTVSVSATGAADAAQAASGVTNAGTNSADKTGLHYRTTAVTRLLSELRANPRKHNNLRCPDFLAYLHKYDPATVAAAVASASGTAGANVGEQGANALQSELSLSTLGSGHTGSGAVEGATEVTPLDAVQQSWQLNHACLLALCCALHTELHPECVRLEKALKNAVYADETGAVLRSAGHSGTGSAGGSGVDYSGAASGVANSGGSAAAQGGSSANGHSAR
jgi:hypothetical protein